MLPNFNTFSRCGNDLEYEKPPEGKSPYGRTQREKLALQVSGLVVATYWMDAYPTRFIPQRPWLEGLFGRAGLSESEIVSPLVTAYAEDVDTPLTGDQRDYARGISTFKTLEHLIDALEPTPPDPDRKHISVRKGPITRKHIATVLPPLVAKLGEQLQAEGHEPFSWTYLHDVREQYEQLRRSG